MAKLAPKREVLAEKTKRHLYLNSTSRISVGLRLCQVSSAQQEGTWQDKYKQGCVGCTDSNYSVTVVSLTIFSWSQFLLRDRITEAAVFKGVVEREGVPVRGVWEERIGLEKKKNTLRDSSAPLWPQLTIPAQQ